MAAPQPFRHRARRLWVWCAALLALLSGCSSTAVLDRLVPVETYTGRNGVAYGPDPRQQLDIYLPLPDRAPAAGRPLVVFLYGGSWTSGERAEYRFVGEALASRGIVTLVADYRLSPQVRYPVFVQDSALAVKWALDHATELGADPHRVFVMGHSAGGYNAAMVALDARWLGALDAQPSQLAGWIGLAGPYEFLPIGVPEVQVAFNWPQTQMESQPIAHVSAQAPRTMLLAAVKDTSVAPKRNTGALAERLQVAGADVTVRMYENLSHVTLAGALATPLNFLGPVADDVAAFVLKAPPAPGR